MWSCVLTPNPHSPLTLHSGPNVQNVATAVEQVYPLLFECQKPRNWCICYKRESTLSLDFMLGFIIMSATDF